MWQNSRKGPLVVFLVFRVVCSPTHGVDRDLVENVTQMVAKFEWKEGQTCMKTVSLAPKDRVALLGKGLPELPRTT